MSDYIKEKVEQLKKLLENRDDEGHLDTDDKEFIYFLKSSLQEMEERVREEERKRIRALRKPDLDKDTEYSWATYSHDSAIELGQHQGWNWAIDELLKENWICGKCEQEEGKYPNSEPLPEHSRHCPKRIFSSEEKKESGEKECKYLTEGFEYYCQTHQTVHSIPEIYREKECECICHYTLQVLTTPKGATLRKECSHCSPKKEKRGR